METVKVIYIAGAGRSGSTLLDRILGTIEGVSSFNEIYRFPINVHVEKSMCSCGVFPESCPFWKAIINEALETDRHDVNRILHLQNVIDHSRHFFRLYTGRYDKDFGMLFEEYKKWLRRLYFSIARTSGNNIIIDSSKVPTRALILSQISGVEVYVIHLVRHPSAVAFSWQKKKYDPGLNREMKKYSLFRTTMFWMIRNILTELIGHRMPYVRVRYEDICGKPASELQSLIDKIKPLRGSRLPFVNEDTIHLSLVHTLSGNPDRFKVGPTTIYNDAVWRTKINPLRYAAISALTLPMLLRYRYLGSDRRFF